MKTIKEFSSKSHINAALIRAVVKQCGGFDSFKELSHDVCNHGADGGFRGFIYYTETCEFFRLNREHIKLALCNMADDLGESMIDMVRGFNCLGKDDYSVDDVALTLFADKRHENTQVANACAWFALEEVARSYCDLSE